MKRIVLVLAMLAGSVFLAVSPASADPPDDTDKKVDICHLPPGNTANGQSISVSYDSIINGTGHGNDGLDIIPPFNYVKQGVDGSFPGQNWGGEGQAQYDNGCDKAKSTQPSDTVENKDETADPNCVENIVTTTSYTRSTSYVFDEGSWSWVPGTPGEWVEDLTTSRARVTTAEECPGTPALEDDTDHKIDICHLPPGNPENGQSIEVDYDSIINATGHGNDGLDIIPPFDYVKQGVDGSFPGQNWDAEGQAQYNNSCVTIQLATPVEPSVTAIETCGEYGSVVLPTTEGVTYAFDPAGDSPTQGPWTVVATPNSGFVFPAETVTTWSGNLGTYTECPEVAAAVAPSITEILTCGEFGSVVLPTTEGVTYAFDPAGDSPTEGPWTVVATANEGFVFADGDTTSWNGDLGAHTECVSAVVLTDVPCEGVETPVSPETMGVIYTYTVGDGLAGLWEITATAEEGYVLVGQSVFSGDAGVGGCVEGVSLEALGDVDAEDALLPDTGGTSLGLLMIGGLMTIAGVGVLARRRILE